MDSGSLAHLYGTNSVPSYSELQTLKELLAPDEIELSRLEKEIKRIQELLQPLYEEKKAIEDRIRPLKSLSSLVRHLPPEIMQEIFMHSRPWSYSRTSGICDAPLLLLRVCRSWRDLALTTPQLWASLDVAVPKHLAVSEASTESKMDVYTAEIRRWITRSGDAPLSLRIRQDHYSRGHANFFITILQDYLKHSPRLVSIDLRVEREVLEAITPTLDARSLIGLSTVKIWDSSYDPPSKIFAASNLLKVKNLKHFHFLPSYCPTFTDLPLKWSNLTSLSIGASQTTRLFFPGNVDEIPFSASESISILRRTPHLVSCTLMLPSFATPRAQEDEDHGDHRDRATVMLQNLETLRMTGPDEELATIIQRIETPRIRNFTYHPWVPADSRSMTPIFQPFPHHPPVPADRPVITTSQSLPLLDFFNRYGEGIESISIDPLDITENDLTASLERIPAVKDLYLGPAQSVSMYYHPAISQLGNRSIPFTNAHLALLTPKPHSLCPRLENFQCTMPASLTQDAICSFLDARLDAKNIASGVGRIQSLSFPSLQLDFPLMEFMDATNRYREEFVKLHLWKDMHNQPTFSGGFNARLTPWMDDL